MKESNHSSTATTSTAPIGQNLVKLISNLCFSVFVFSVLIFTIIAHHLPTPYPWLKSAPALTKLFTQPQNATFHIDNSILNTGEDLTLSPQDPPLPLRLPSSSFAPITKDLIKKIKQKITNSTPLVSNCNESQGTMNCSDPRVLIVVERFNLIASMSIPFLDERKRGFDLVSNKG